MSKNKLILISLLQAFSLFAYILLVVEIMSNMEHSFGNRFWQPVAMLILFVVSAAISGFLVLGKSITLYLDNFKKEAIELFGYTIAWLALIAATVFVVLASLK